jgi:hypothetical protein
LPHRSDAIDLPQAVRLGLDDVKYLVPESSQQFLGVDWPNASDHARGKVLLDAVERCRGRGLEKPGFELLTMSAVIRPVTGGRDPLTSGNHRSVANDRDEIAVTSRLYPDDAKAVLGVLVGDALDQPGKHLPVRWLWLGLHEVIVAVWSDVRIVPGAPAGTDLGSQARWEHVRSCSRASNFHLSPHVCRSEPALSRAFHVLIESGGIPLRGGL